MPVDRFDTAICGVCARSATGIGICPDPNHKKPVLWICDDPTCIADARNSYDMKQDHFSRREDMATRLGSQEAGEYLASIGVSSFDQLTAEQWHEMWRRGIAGYRKALKSAVQNEAPF